MTAPEPTPTPEAGAPGRFHIRQKITPFQNTYRVFLDRQGEPGDLIAFAKQKRMAFKESFTLYADETATRPLMTIKADRRIDIRSAMTVTDAATGATIGVLRKKGAASILRSTWELEQAGMPLVTVQERNAVIGILRRFWGLIPYAGSVPIPWVFHFDGTAGGVPVLSHTRLWGIRDRYVLEVTSPVLDPRLAIAMAICLDAMQKR
jgi:hypothetical protein